MRYRTLSVADLIVLHNHDNDDLFVGSSLMSKIGIKNG